MSTTTITLTTEQAQIIHAALLTLMAHLDTWSQDQALLEVSEPGTLRADAAGSRIDNAGHIADAAAQLQWVLDDDAGLTDLDLAQWPSSLRDLAGY